MGPMAQDFYAAFGLGLGERAIDTVDPDGVAMAAIQALHELVQEKDSEIQELRDDLAHLKVAVTQMQELTDAEALEMRSAR